MIECSCGDVSAVVWQWHAGHLTALGAAATGVKHMLHLECHGMITLLRVAVLHLQAVLH